MARGHESGERRTSGPAVKLSLLLVLLASLPALAEDPQVVTLVSQGAAAETRGDIRGALALFRQAEAIEPANVGVLLRVSKQYGDLIARTQPPAAAQKTAERALEYARRAATLDPANAKSRLNLAICYGRLIDFVGNKTKLEYSRIVEAETQQSLALDPTDDFAWHVLGRWHLGVANAHGVLKTLARFVYGGLPTASNEEAVRCLKNATELAPQRLMHHAELAHAHTAAGQADLALQDWQNVLGIRPVGAEYEKYQQEARVALETARKKNAGKPTKYTTQR
jgi:Tfp pilus assembly protein PilF